MRNRRQFLIFVRRESLYDALSLTASQFMFNFLQVQEQLSEKIIELNEEKSVSIGLKQALNEALAERDDAKKDLVECEKKLATALQELEGRSSM